MAMDAKRRMELEVEWQWRMKFLAGLTPDRVRETGAEFTAVKAMLDGETFYFAASDADGTGRSFKANAVVARQLAISILQQAQDLFPEDRLEVQTAPPRPERN